MFLGGSTWHRLYDQIIKPGAREPLEPTAEFNTSNYSLFF
jgi:hypothetical protein